MLVIDWYFMSENKENHENNGYQITIVRDFLPLDVLSKHTTFSVICKSLRPDNRNPAFTYEKNQRSFGRGSGGQEKAPLGLLQKFH